MKKPARRKTPAITHAGITIREIRPGYYMIDAFRQGRRERQCFHSLSDAKVHAEQLAIAIKNEGASVLDLTPDQRIDAVSAFREARGAVTLLDAVKYWMIHNGIAEGTTLQQIANKWQVALRAQGCRDTTLAEREQKTTRLCRDLGTTTAASITKQTIIDWMDSYKLTGQTRDGYRRCFRAMFQYAVEENLAAVNPVAGIKKIRMDEKLPECFSVKQAESILTTAAKHAPIMVPTLAVQFFAGLRPNEAMGLDWRNIDFTEKIIRVTPETSKVRRTRIIDMNPSLQAWLTPHKKSAGAIGIETRNQWGFYMQVKDIDAKKGVLGAAGIDWIKDGPRHTYASMHYATHGDAAKLASILGHTGGHDVLFRHYRGLVKKTEAAKYWKIRPAKSQAKDNTILMRGAA
jgi:integrase